MSKNKFVFSLLAVLVVLFPIGACGVFRLDTGAPVTVDLAAQGFPAVSRLPQNPFAGFLGLTFNTVSSISEDYRISGKIDNILFY